MHDGNVWTLLRDFQVGPMGNETELIGLTDQHSNLYIVKIGNKQAQKLSIRLITKSLSSMLMVTDKDKHFRISNWFYFKSSCCLRVDLVFGWSCITFKF